MAPIPIDVAGWDTRKISWWQRNITFPRCVWCNKWMVRHEWKDDIWKCKRCDQFTIHNSNIKKGEVEMYTFRTKIIE